MSDSSGVYQIVQTKEGKMIVANDIGNGIKKEKCGNLLLPFSFVELAFS